MRRWFRFLATFGPVGYVPMAPATAGSAVVVLIGWFLPVPALAIALLLLAAGTALAVGIANEAEKDLGHDAQPIVVDEAVGQSLALLFAPHTVPAFAAAFVLFRVLDVWKPLGARGIQRLPGGLGVVADDVIAGLTACGAFHLGVWAIRAMGWAG